MSQKKRKQQAVPTEEQKARKRETLRKWHAANPEKRGEYDRKWRTTNPERKRKSDRKWYAANKERHREQGRKWLAANPEKVLGQSRKTRTGFTPAMFAAMLAEQGNACAVCRRPFSEKLKPHADHCHKTKQPRGVLCHHCNVGEGYVLKTGLSPKCFGVALSAYLAKW